MAPKKGEVESARFGGLTRNIGINEDWNSEINRASHWELRQQMSELTKQQQTFGFDERKMDLI